MKRQKPKLEKARDLQLKQPNVNLTGGFGWMGENGCLIDNDSALRSNTLSVFSLKTNFLDFA